MSAAVAGSAAQLAARQGCCTPVPACQGCRLPRPRTGRAMGLDGWCRIINAHPQFDGVKFLQDSESCTCVIYRKDRGRAIRVTEYMSECRREHLPSWQSHPKRMLRNRALVQCARLAFGLSGIYDQDEVFSAAPFQEGFIDKSRRGVEGGAPEEWRTKRLGKATASRMCDILAVLKSGHEAASRKNYRAELVAERLTGAPMEGYVNAAMRWGLDFEPFARAAYEAERGVMVEEPGFVAHPQMPMSGASPDGLVNDDGIIEIKCPNTATHIEYLLRREAPAEYQPQMLWQMECTGRAWCDFVSFDPRLPAEMQLFIVRFERDEERISAMREAAGKFLDEVDEALEKLREAVAQGI